MLRPSGSRHPSGLAAAAIAALALTLEAGSARAAAGEDTTMAATGEPTGRLLFEVRRDGSRIGTHRVAFRRRGSDRLDVAIDIELKVGLGPITLFRYEHSNRIVWRDGSLAAMTANTNDNGDTHDVEVMRSGDGNLRLRTKAGVRTIGADILPSTYWMSATVRQSELLNTQTGELAAVSVTQLGTESVATPDGPVRARAYDLAGGLSARIWYAPDGTWVGLAFDARGDRITYHLIKKSGHIPTTPHVHGAS